MSDKPKSYQEIQNKIWDNLKSNGLLTEILSKSVHAAQESDYTSIELLPELAQYKVYAKEN
jgi:hypothetical protein